MKNRILALILAALAALPCLALGAANDVYIDQRFPDNSITFKRTVVPPANGDALLGYGGVSKLPVYWSLGDNLVLSNGVLSVPVTAGATGATGATGPAGPVGAASTVPGPTGANGSPGADGISPVLSIGTVSTGASSSANITGTTAAPKLNLVLQKGDAGAAGATGQAGPQGLAGATGATGPAGPAGSDAVLPPRYYKRLTTDAAGALTVTFPSGRFSSVPEISAQVVNSDQSYIYTAQVLSVSATSATVQVSRVTMSTFTLLGLTSITVASKPTTAQVVSIRADLASD